MRLTLTSVRPTLILQTSTSRPVSSFFRMARDQLALPTRATLPFRKTFILRLTNLPPSTDLLLLSGALNLRSHLRAQLHQHLVLLAGIVRWLR
jgi:hypothetical protein